MRGQYMGVHSVQRMLYDEKIKTDPDTLSGYNFFVYTDGVPEAEMFGLERMMEALNACADGSPDDILQKVKSAVDDFVGDAEPFDDLTMMCLEYKGRGGPSV